MTNDIPYWYNNMSGANLVSDIPAQAIPSHLKTDKFKEKTMDALERIGIKQFNENKRFVDYYRMTEGKVSYVELAELIPQLRELSGLLDDFQIPNTIKHYDILGIILNYLEAVMMENRDKFHPTNIDEIATNERQREQADLIHKYIKEQVDKRIAVKLAKDYGLDVNRNEFKSEEEKQQYLEEIEKYKQALTPPEIKTYLETDFKTIGLRWCEAMLEADKQRFRLDEISRKNIHDYLRTGRCFRHYFLKYDSYAVEDWSPINTFFSQTVDAKYPQYGEYIGRIHFYTPSDFINKKGHNFSEKKKKEILKAFNSEDYDIEGGGELGLNSAMEQGFQKSNIVPHANYYDYNFLVSLQEELGIPMATKTIIKKDGTTETVEDFLPKRNSLSGSNSVQYARFLRDDLNIRTDMIMVTEAYWRSYKRVGYLTYINKDGLLTSELVTDELIKDFLENNGIKSITNVSLEDIRNKPRQPNTIVWDYIPVVWAGEKALTSSTSLGKDEYYNIRELEYQIRGDSNLFDVSLPVAGIVDVNPADKIMPYQNMFNIVSNQQHNLQEKELGIFFLFDINFLPADIKEYGDTETSLYNLMNIVRGTSLLGVDGASQNLQGKTAFSQFAVQDMSLGRMIQEKQIQAEYYKSKAFEQFGLNPTALGQPVKYMTAEGVDQNAHSTQTQTDYLYDAFSNFESRALEIHINIAQYAQGDGRDITVEYTKNDLSQAFLKFSDKFFPLRKFGIMAVSDSKKRKELEMMKQYILNQNTMTMDELALSSLISSDSMQSLIAIARLERLKKEESIAAEREHELSIIGANKSAKSYDTYLNWQLAEITNIRDRINYLNIERIESLGRAADNDASTETLEYINNEADRALKIKADIRNDETKNRGIDAMIGIAKDNYKLKEKDLKLKSDKLKIEEKKIDAEIYTSRINKN